MTPVIGQTLSHYQILGKIGAGGMGEVYRAKDDRLGREVAIKVLPAAYSADPERMRRFEQEARAAGMLNHPNILTIYDIGSHEGSPFVVSELLEGETLRERLDGGSPGARKTIDYALQVVHGLAAAHDKGIVHRDLKPENIFITRDGRVKILDFGLAKLTQPDPVAGTVTSAPTMAAATQPGTVLGTVGYMSPEQVRGRPTDSRSDIFTFGTILYEMLAGRRAFQGESAVEALNAVLKEDPPDLLETHPGLPPALARVVRHCLERSPEERFQSARDIAFNLDALTALSSSSAVAVAVAPAGLGKRTRLALTVVAAAALLALTFVGGRKAGFLAGEAAATPPSYTQLTFRRGAIATARFAPDGQTIVYASAWDGNPVELFSIRQEFPESRPLGLARARVAGISPSGEMAVILGRVGGAIFPGGTLARLPLAGGSPREILEQVSYADWGPDGKQLVVVHHVEGKARLEYPIGKVLYETRGDISYPHVSPRGDLVAFFEHPARGDNRGSVVIVDLAGKKTALPAIWANTEGLAWSRQNPDEIWFTASKAGAIRGLYGVTVTGRQRIVMRVPGAMSLQDIDARGRLLLIRDNYRSEMIALGPGETQERNLTWFDWSYPRDISPDGRLVLFDEEGGAAGSTYAACIRKTDGSPPIRLGEGIPLALSPDGKWALVRNPDTGALSLLTTGAGEPRPVKTTPVENFGRPFWFADSKRFVVAGREPGAPPRCYVISVEGESTPKPVTPPDTISCMVSADGKSIAAVAASFDLAIYPLEGGEPRRVSRVEPTDRLTQWSSDGRYLYLGRLGEANARVDRLELTTGRRTPWKEITIPDRAGVVGVGPIVITPDGKYYAYRYGRNLSDLYLVEGLR